VFKPNEKIGNQIHRPVVTMDIRDVTDESSNSYPFVTSSKLLNYLMKYFPVIDKRTIRQAVLVLEKKEREKKQAVEKETQMNEMESMLRKVLETLYTN
jgi:hypothetical protein